MMYYEIDDNNVLSVYNDELEPPLVLIQDSWQNGEKFLDKADASAWADVYVQQFNGEIPGYGVGFDRDNNPRQLDEPEEEAEV